jgi:hypothetical protein
VEGLRAAVTREFLFCFNDYRDGPCYLITDKARRSAIYRRLDGNPFGYANGERVADHRQRSKSKLWLGSKANWPIGAEESREYPAIAITEGMPDFLSGFSHAWASAVERCVAPVCMSSASVSIPEAALEIFSGKRIRIFGHADDKGRQAMERWGWELSEVGANIDYFDFHGLIQGDGRPVKDLNDLCLADFRRSECDATAFFGYMDFGLERSTRTWRE